MTVPSSCLNCHTPLPEGGRFCPKCGLDSSDPGTTEPVDVDPDVLNYARLWRAIGDHYTLERVLGRGGMGIVFLARDVILERQVALKVLPPDLAGDERLVGRFQREARTAAKLDHPGIVPIHAVESAAGYHYFAMKFVPGHSVETLIEAGPIPVETALHILQDAASALAHAHQHGVVHRDIKPSNIMVDQHGRAIVMDFGISKAIQSGAGFTQSGQIIGTPYYMSPEQAKGLALDGRSDQYSLALVGYHMLTGKIPFEADSPHVVLLKHISEVLPPVATVRPDIPAHASEALARGLAKEPHERFATMEDFADALTGRAAITAPSLRGPPPSSTGGKPGAKRPAWVRAALATLAVVTVAATLLVRGGLIPGFAGTEGSRQDSALSPAGTAVPVAAQPRITPSEPAAQPVESAPSRSRSAITPQRTSPPPGPAPQARAPAVAATASAAATVGWLTIDSDPFGTVQIDGVDIRDTPLVRQPLAPGTYSVSIIREGYRTWTASITITAANTVQRRVTLVPSQ